LGYAYATAQGELRGVGIVGPLVHASACDEVELAVDDIYALFAGYHAEHEAIQETPFADLTGMEQHMVEMLCAEIGPEYTDLTPVKLGRLFGERHLICTAARDGLPGTVVLDANEPHWYPACNARRPLGTTEAYQIHKGRKLLRAFNAPRESPPAE
jgi:hypothetical protein